MMIRLPRCRHAAALIAGTGLALVPGYATAQTFSAQISPNPAPLIAGGPARSVTVSTTISGGFTGDIIYSFSGFPAGISTGGMQIVVDPYPPVTFTFSAAPGVPRGTYTGTLTGITPDATLVETFPMTVIVERPDFSLSVLPSSVSVERGGTAAVTVTATPIDGFSGSVSVVSPVLSGITFDPTSFELPAGGARTVTITASPGAAIGTIIGAFVGTSVQVPGKRAASLRIQVTGPPPPPPPAQDFSLTASPASLSLAPGESSVVDVSAVGTGGFAGSIMVSGSGAGLSLQPAAFALAPGSAQAVVVTVSETAPAGAIPLVFSGTAAGIAGARTTMASVVVVASSAPVIRFVTPPSVVTGTTGNVLRVTGEGFAPGAVISSGSPGVRVTAARILGRGAAEVTIAVRPDAAPGPYRLDLRNPDGALATGGATLLVHPAGSLSAPLAVTAAAIVHPRPWQILEPGGRDHAQALLAVSGMGTLVGTWVLDGVPFDRFTRIVTGGFPVEVRSTIPIPQSFTGEHRLELAIESPQSLPPQEVPFFQAVESRSELRVLAPDGGAIVDPTDPVFRWTLVPGASGYEVEIEDAGESAERPWTAVRRRVTDTEWRPEQPLLRALGAGAKRFRVRAVFPGDVMGDPTEWSAFLLSRPFEPGDEPGTGSDETTWLGAPFRLTSTLASPSIAHRGPEIPTSEGEVVSGGEVGLTLQSMTTTIASDFEDPPPLTRLQLSTQTDWRGAVFDQQATADLSGSHDIEDPWHAREESRAWLTRFGATRGGFRQEATLGFAPPSFFDQTEFLTVTSAGGGLQGTLGSPAGSVSYYRSLDLSANGGFAAVEPDIDAAAYQAADAAGRFLFRTMWLQVTDPAVDDFSAGGDGRALGVIGVAHVKPWLRLLGEAAGGEFERGQGSFEENRDGKAFRLALDGTTSTFGYAFLVGRTGEGFVNPANRGFTPGGISDRTRAELSLSKYFGQASLSGKYSHIRGGISKAAGDPETTENGAGVVFALPIGPRVSLSAGGNVTSQDGDALEEIGLPATDRTQKGLELGVTETLGPLSLSQGISWQDFSDQVQPVLDQEVTSLSLAASGALAPAVSLSAQVSNTRTQAAPEIGQTDQLLVSLQPALTLQKAWLSLIPRAAWTRVSNDLDDSRFRTDQYQVVMRWTPPWAGALLNLEVSSDWNRSWTDLDPDPPSFDRQTVLTLTLNWRFDRSWAGGAATDTHPTQVALVNHRRMEELE